MILWDYIKEQMLRYGTKCHPIEDDEGEMTMFNLDLVRNEKVIIEKMF